MEPVYIATRVILVPLLWLLFRFRTVGRIKIPRSGPVIVVPNHISNFDPLCVAYLIDRSGRRPRFLGKASIWKNRFLRFVFDGAGQIPVNRGTGETSPMVAAEAAIRRGEVVVVYPEGTITSDSDLWPMRGKTGVARLALSTGAPVYPVAVWGAQWIAGKGRRSRYFGHNSIMFNIGSPMTFPELAGRQDEADVRREVTDRVMSEVDRLVRELRKIHPDRGAVPPRTRGKL